jgi:hypothetical protein
MTTKFIGKCGIVIGQADDEIAIMAEDVEEAMEKLLGYSDSEWPESDGEYDAVVWIEDDDGELLASEDVTIMADGNRSLPA